MSTLGPAVVALGGGHGLAASLNALRRVTTDLTAVVTVADNGGSSGRLREEFAVPAPGDLRMALAALCGDDRWGQTWAEVLQHRFSSEGELHGHAVGNLLIVALWEIFGQDPRGLVIGLDWVAGLLGAKGRVLPMAASPIDICAEVVGLDPEAPDAVSAVRGQVQVATTPGKVRSVTLVPPNPMPCPQTIDAVKKADAIFLGPGSWYSSVIPHLLVPDLRDALIESRARVIVNMNLVAQQGETTGFTAADHLQVLLDHAPGLRIDTVLADVTSVGEATALGDLATANGAALMLADVANEADPSQHDPDKLARAYAALLRAT